MPQYQTYSEVTEVLAPDKILFFKDAAGVLKTITFENFAAAIVDSTAGTGLSAVANIAGLEDFETTTLITGAQLSVAGYYAPNDGGGGLFYYNASATDTPDDGTIFAPNSGVGRWFRILQGRALSVKMFGATGNGVTDDTDALQAAFTAMRAAAPNISLSFDPGIYQCTETLLVEGNQVKIIGNNAKIRASASIAGPLMQVGDGAVTAAIEFLVVTDLYLDANNNATYGVYIIESQNISFSNCTANSGTIAAWYVDGSAAGGSLRVINITFTNCFAGSATQACFGWYFNKNGNTGAFERFTMVGCGAEACTNLVRCEGVFGMQIIGGTFQNASTSSIYCSGTQLMLYGSYFEAGGVIKDLIVDNGATVMCSQAFLSQGAQYNDSASVISYRDGTLSNELGFLITDSNTGRMADRPDSWGNPQWPTGISGSTSRKGLSYTDKYGTEWTCITGAPDSTYSPRYGTFIIPMRYDEFSNGKLWWWAMEDFVVTEFYMVITETFTGTATVTGFGTEDTKQGAWISIDQGNIAYLTAGNVINAADNVHADRVLDGTKKKYLAGKGNLSSNAQPSAIVQYGHATGWTAGQAYLLIRGFNLKFN